MARAPQAHIRRLPPTARHFAGQRVRQAYDSLAQPPRLAAELALLPAVAVAAWTRRFAALGWAATPVAVLRRAYLLGAAGSAEAGPRVRPALPAAGPAIPPGG